MIDNDYLQLSGSLFYPPKSRNFWDCIRTFDAAHDFQELLPGWIRFYVTPDESWSATHNRSEDIENTDRITYFVRKGNKGRILLVSTRNELVVQLLHKIDCSNWINSTPTVKIGSLLNDLIARPRKIDNYSIGAIYAKVEGYGQSLRTIILYGDDIASTPFFEEKVLPNTLPYRITLRKNRWREVMSIGEKADIYFPYRNTDSLKEIDDLVKVIGLTHGHLDWETEDYE